MEELISWEDYLEHLDACRICEFADLDCSGACENCEHDLLYQRPRCPECDENMVYASDDCKESGMTAKEADYFCLACGFNLVKEKVVTHST